MRCAYCEQRATTGTVGDCVPACDGHRDVAAEANHAARRARLAGARTADTEWGRHVERVANGARSSAMAPGHARGWRIF